MDFIANEKELILESPTYKNEIRLLLNFNVGIPKIEYDSLLRDLIVNKRIKKVNDTLFYLILPNKRDDNHSDFFRLAPAFRNDSLKAMLCELREGYFNKNSPSFYFEDFKTLLTEKYGLPKLIFVKESRKMVYNNQIVSELGWSKYSSWIKNGLLIKLNEYSYPERNSDKESRWLNIYYESLDFEKSRILNDLKEEKLDSLEKSNLKKEKRKKDIESDSIRRSVF